MEIIAPLHASLRSQVRVPVRIRVSFSFLPEAAWNNACEPLAVHTRSLCGPESGRAARSQAGAFQNPRNRSFWNEHSFWYYTRSEFAAELPEFVGRFQVSRLRTFCPDPLAIPHAEAHLFALKPGYEPMGAVAI